MAGSGVDRGYWGKKRLKEQERIVPPKEEHGAGIGRRKKDK
jgi:hypothetical protein